MIARNRNTLAGMLEELNLAYTDVYTDKAQTGEINARVSLNEVYSKLSTEIKSHIYTVDGTSTISLVNSNQSSITLLNDAEAIGSTGTAGQNTISVEIHEERESTSYYLESDGMYYPMCIRNFKIELDETNATTTQPTGAESLESGIEISFIDEGENEEKSESNFITASREETTITITARANTGTTQVVLRDGDVTLTGNIEVTVNPTYTISLGTMTNGNVSITTNNIDTTSNTKYGSGVEIILKAVGDPGYAFKKWNDNNSTANSRAINVNETTSTVTYAAEFKNESYVGYYVNKGTTENPEYAIIYADLLADSGELLKGMQYCSVRMPTTTLTQNDYKTYAKSDTKIPTTTTGSKFGDNYEVTVTGNELGEERFLAMSLSDVDSSGHCWYNKMFNNQNNTAVVAGNLEIGGGITNSKIMVSAWNKATYGARNGDYSGYTDAWGKVKNGWFIPSYGEWIAFSAMCIKMDDTFYTANKWSSTYGLSSHYWSSSQDGTNNVKFWNVSSATMGSNNIAQYCYRGYMKVRLSTTF